MDEKEFPMKVIVASHAGHCFGVKTAIQKAFKTAQEAKQPVYTLGPIIHNPQVVARLEKEQVSAVKNLSEIDEGVIIIRSHGVAPQVIQEAEAKGLTVVDATCPFVRRAHELAQALIAEGYQLVILGDRHHPEVKGILGAVNHQAVVVTGENDVLPLPRHNQYGLIAQTTQNLSNLQQVVCVLLTKTSNLKVCNTICNATRDLQTETKTLAEKVDVMLVVGGKNSANTTQLAAICRAIGKPTYHIETAQEISREWLAPHISIGVTAGTSTPDWIIDSILERLRSWGATI